MGFWDVINPFKTNFEWVTEYDTLRLVYSVAVRRRTLSTYPGQVSELDSLARTIDAKLNDCVRGKRSYFFCNVDRISIELFKTKLQELAAKVLSVEETKLLSLPSPTTEAVKGTIADLPNILPNYGKQLLAVGIIVLFAIVLFRR